ncbi:MAG TPA: hypothetical protein VLA99_08835, partial [Nitrospiraceae bacterium]|nr:hypothetical protein [Nitrospiraceae bacterium]
TGRLVFSCIVALGALFIQFGLFRPNCLLWALIAGSFLVPLLDRLFPGARYDWATPSANRSHSTGFTPGPVRLSPSMSQPRGFL